MKRLLALLLSLATVAAATSAPALACAGSMTVAERHHRCCDERTVSPTTAGSCCFLTQPAAERAFTESRNFTEKERHANLDAVSQPVWAGVSDRSPRSRTLGSSSPAVPIPIYIRQLSLLL